MKHFQLLLINLSLLLASVLAAPYEIPLHRRSALPAPTELRQWLEKAAADPQQQQHLAMPRKGKCPFRDMPSLNNLMDKRVRKESSKGSESPLNNFVDTFLVAEISFGTPAQTFNMILDSTMFVMYGVPANFLIDSKTCPEGQGLPCESMRLFNMEKSTSFHKILSVKNYTLASDVMRLGNVEAKGKFMLLNGVNFVGQNSFDLIYNSGALNIPRLDGIFSMAFSSQFMPLSSGMEYLLQDQSSKVATIYIEPLTALDFFAAQTGMVTVGGLDTQRCAHNWEWVNVPLMAQRWQIPLSSVDFASHSFGGGNAFFSTFHTFIYGPRESLAPILDLVKPVGPLDGKVPKDVAIECVRSNLPDIHFQFGKQRFTLTPSQYVLDVIIDPLDPSKNICHLMIRPTPDDLPDIKSLMKPNDWFFGQLFLNQFCVAFDYTRRNQKIGLAPHL